MKIKFKFSKKSLFAIIIYIVVVALILTLHFCKVKKEKYDNAEKFKELVEVTEPTEENGEPTCKVDFESLKEINSDIYAWIDIPDTVISYPVLRHVVEDYYLTHNVDMEESKYGALYTQNYNTATFEDFNTVIYGHNTRNGSMFGTLRKFRDKEFFNTHKVINIYTPEQKFTYKVFAAYTTDDSHILYKNDFSDMAVRQKYISDILGGKKGGNVDKDIQITEEDKIITLSTCTTPKTKRLLVHAVLQSVENN